MNPDVEGILKGLGSTILWTLVSVAIAAVVIEVMNWRYHLMDEIFKDNDTGAAILAGSFVLGIFYTVAQIVTH
ncbi:MAG: hypothetical protein QOF51_4183 [Chloroflexota bacterium]|jgi:hypothetical protein|nr:hypothetical protein [Chloroflexota bacterium]